MKKLAIAIALVMLAATACGGGGSGSSFANIADMQKQLDAEGLTCEGTPTAPDASEDDFGLFEEIEAEEELDCTIDGVDIKIGRWDDPAGVDKALENLEKALTMFCGFAEGSDDGETDTDGYLGHGQNWVVDVADSGTNDDEAINNVVEKVTNALGGKVTKLSCD